MNLKNKVIISCSINKEIADWLTKRAEEWKVPRSWLIENLLYSAMIKSGVLPDADIKENQ